MYTNSTSSQRGMTWKNLIDNFFNKYYEIRKRIRRRTGEEPLLTYFRPRSARLAGIKILAFCQKECFSVALVKVQISQLATGGGLTGETTWPLTAHPNRQPGGGENASPLLSLVTCYHSCLASRTNSHQAKVNPGFA